MFTSRRRLFMFLWPVLLWHLPVRAQETTAVQPTGTQIRWVPLHQLERSLPREPIRVVFDVDDTALFSSPGFQWGTAQYGNHIVSAGVSLREEDLASSEDRRKFR